MLNIAAATAEDIPALIELAIEIYGKPSRNLAESEFPTAFTPGTRCPTYLLAARFNGELIGLSGIMEDYIYVDTFCLCWVGVRQSFRGKGIGSALVQAGIGRAQSLVRRKAGSVILVTEEKNRTYYARFGFTGTTLIHPYLESTEPHFLLTRQISPL